ncbi:MAG: response regulator [Flavobacteriales bacterium]
MQTIDRLYIIDDDKVVLHIFDRLVRKKGCFGIVEAFLDSEDAMQKIKTQLEIKTDIPDIVLIDINMPRVDGWEFIEMLEIDQPQHSIPFMIISSSIDPEDIERSKRYPCVLDFIPKPLSLDKLDYIIERYHNLENVGKR